MGTSESECYQDMNVIYDKLLVPYKGCFKTFLGVISLQEDVNDIGTVGSTCCFYNDNIDFYVLLSSL